MAAGTHFRQRSTRRSSDVSVIDLRDEKREMAEKAQLREVKIFGSPAFRRLWFSQVASSLGDWIGIIALTAYANALANGSAVGALTGVSLVLAVRLIPGFFLSPVAGVLLDRWDRKRVMVICDIGRALVLFSIPFTVDSLVGLVIVSLLLELLTLMWAPAKEASVPNLVPASFLPSANSLSLAAAYGPILIAAPLFGVLAKTPEWLGLTGVDGNDFALLVDGGTYLLSALVIATLTIPRRHKNDQPVDLTLESASGVAQAREGWVYLRRNVKVRTAVIGLATGIFGGAMVVPLGAAFSQEVVRAGEGGYSLLLSSLGGGAAIGMVSLTFLQKKLVGQRYFVIALMLAGFCLFAAATMNDLAFAAAFTAGMGLFAGSAYVLGFSAVQVNTADEMRGRVMATLYTITRFCVLGALVVAPLLAILLGDIADNLTGGSIEVLGFSFILPGVRLVFWFGGLTMIAGALLALSSLRRPARSS